MYSKIWKQTFKDKEFINIIELKITETEVELKKIKIKRHLNFLFSKKIIKKYKGTIIQDNIVFDKEYKNKEWKYMSAENIMICRYEISNTKFILNKLNKKQ